MAAGLLSDSGDTQAAAPPPADGAPQPTATPATGTIPQQPVPQYQQPAVTAPPPKPMSKLQSGVADILGDLADSLAGKTRQTVYRDATTGERIVENTPQTRKQQWGTILARAVSGAGAGAGAAPGPGNKLRALSAGIQTGEAQAQQQKQQQESLSDEDFKAKRDVMMQNANLAVLGAKTSAASFDLAQAKVKALEGTVENNNSVDKIIQDEGGEDLGLVRTPADLVALTKNNPDLIKAHMNGGIYHALHFDDAGNYDGMRYYTIPTDAGKQKIGEDVKIRTLIPGKTVDDKPTVGFYTVPKGSKTVAEVAALSQAADEKISSTQLKQYNDDQKAQQAASRTRAENAASYGAAAKDKAEGEKTLSETSDADLVDAMGTGHVPAERMSYILARKPELVQAIVAKYPDFDGSKAEAYPQVYKEFTSTKPGTAGAAINNGATALKHLKELHDMNTVASHIPGTAEYKAYQNKLDTVAPELAKFYGDSTVPGIASYRSTLGSTLPGNRDAAIRTQAKSMGDKLDSYEQTWKNAAPSKAYEAPMPQIDDEAKAARASLDPNYKNRSVSAQNVVKPGEPTATAADGSTLVVRNGQWVPAQHQ